MLSASPPFQREVHREHADKRHGSNQLQHGFASVSEEEYADNRDDRAYSYPNVRTAKIVHLTPM